MVLCCILYICEAFLADDGPQSVDGNVHDDLSPSHPTPPPHIIGPCHVRLRPACRGTILRPQGACCDPHSSLPLQQLFVNKITKLFGVFHRTWNKVIYLNGRMVVYSEEEEKNGLWLWHYVWGLLLWNTIRGRVESARWPGWCDVIPLQLLNSEALNWSTGLQ